MWVRLGMVEWVPFWFGFDRRRAVFGVKRGFRRLGGFRADGYGFSTANAHIEAGNKLSKTAIDYKGVTEG
jgi:hypothetical protein